MKRARLSRSERAVKKRLDERSSPDPSPTTRDRVMAAARAGLTAKEAAISTPGYLQLPRRLALAAVVAGGALAVVLAVVLPGGREAPVAPAVESLSTQADEGSAPTDAVLLASVDASLNRARSRLRAIGDGSPRFTSRRRPADTVALLERTRRLRQTLARQDLSTN